MDASYLDYSKKFIKKLQQYEVDLQIAKKRADIAAQERDEKIVEAREREEAIRSVLKALVESVRVYGLDKKKLKKTVRDIAQNTPTSGPQAVRHTILFEETSLILGLHRASNC